MPSSPRLRDRLSGAWPSFSPQPLPGVSRAVFCPRCAARLALDGELVLHRCGDAVSRQPIVSAED